MTVINLIMTFIASALVGWVITAILLSALKYLKIGQNIREEGPDSHKKKTGIPTMGGIAIILSIFILTFIFIDIDFRISALLWLFMGYAGIGFFDDLIKVKRAQNLGLTFWQKIFLQGFFALFFTMILITGGYNHTISGILKNLHFDLLFLYIPFIILMVMGTSNAVNLTDGLDGLAAGTLTFAFLSYGIISSVKGSLELALFCMIVAGVTLSFLYFNKFPAKIFMGDVGSLSLGALLAGVSAFIHKELLLIIVGAVFLIEALSVIIQVTYFKLTKKRIFKMSPLHHHFELCSYPEQKIVMGFWGAALIFSLLGVFIEIFL